MNNRPAPRAFRTVLGLATAVVIGLVVSRGVLWLVANGKYLLPVSVPAGFRDEVIATDPVVANPVSLCVDDQNRVYVTETNGFVYSFDYTDEQLALRTVEEAEKLRARDAATNPHPTGRSERVLVLEDRAGAGTLDTARVFADGFDLSDGVAAGVIARDGQVWLANAPKLWRFRAGPDGLPTSREPLLHGFGVRRVNLGHDLHGLVFGPDGKLYFSIGDRGLSVRTREGALVEVADSGAVLRCEPDGADLEVYATGFRNPQKLAFDRYGNLFTCDNDANLGDATRWLYVAEGADAGWRIGYQILPGGGPWQAEKISIAGESPPYCLPSLGRLAQCPAGLAFYPGTGFPPEFDDHFILCDCGRYMISCAVRPKGAGFELTDVRDFVGPIRATDCAFGPDGGLYVSDWSVINDNLGGKGRIHRISHPGARADPVVAETKQLLAAGMTGRPADELARLLGHRDQRVRLRAQEDLTRRGKPGADALTAAIAADRPPMVRVHAVWGLGQVGRREPKALLPLLPLLDDPDPELRAQAARVLGDDRCQAAGDRLLRSLTDDSSRVRYFAALGLGKLRRADAVPALLAMIRGRPAGDPDPFLRHAAVVGLAAAGDPAALRAAVEDADREVRLTVLLAFRRLATPEIRRFLADPDSGLVTEAARAIYDVPIPAALPDLAALADRAALADSPRFPGQPAAIDRVVYANFRLGTPGPLARLAANPRAPDKARVLALAALTNWDACTGKDPLLGLWRPLPARDRAAAAVCVRPILPGLLRPDAAGGAELTAAAARAAAELGGGDVVRELLGIALDQTRPARARAGALNALAAQGGEPLTTAVSALISDPDEDVRRSAVALLGTADVPDAVPRLVSLAETGPVPVRQAAVSALGERRGDAADAALARLLDRAAADHLPTALWLDLLEAAGRRADPAVKTGAARLDAARPANELLAPWWETLDGGNPAAGRAVFHDYLPAGCVRCHKVGDTGGEVGPPLDAAGRHPRRYLLESIVRPNAVLTPGYAQAAIELKTGQLLTGRVVAETATQITLLAVDGSRRDIAVADVESRANSGSAMPEGLAGIMTRRQLRDLIAFLASLRPAETAGLPHKDPPRP